MAAFNDPEVMAALQDGMFLLSHTNLVMLEVLACYSTPLKIILYKLVLCSSIRMNIVSEDC